MRILLILGALLLGLLGLFMSLCGGGFFIRVAYEAVADTFRSGPSQDWPGGMVLLAVPAVCAVVGATLCWSCAKFIRKAMRED
jgi:hypothetical protein